MQKSRMTVVNTRLTAETLNALSAMAGGRPVYDVMRDILVAYVQTALRPPLRDDTMQLLYLTVEAAGYDSADELVQDLCRSLERTMRAVRGELHEGEAEVDNDIQEMFNSVLNEKEVTTRKHI